jgi:hypothetical protein
VELTVHPYENVAVLNPKATVHFFIRESIGFSSWDISNSDYWKRSLRREPLGSKSVAKPHLTDFKERAERPSLRDLPQSRLDLPRILMTRKSVPHKPLLVQRTRERLK